MAELPKWIASEGEADNPSVCGHACGNARSFLFALACRSIGFDLPQYDLWLAALAASVAKDELLSWRDEAERYALTKNDDALKARLESMRLRQRAIQRDDVMRPLAKSEAGRRLAARRDRPKRMQALNRWLDRQDLFSLSNEELYRSLSQGICDEDLYRDGERVVEVDRKGDEHSIGRSGFNKHVTAARKRKTPH